ncbi:VWA domain-containing protein [Bacillus sp. S/N-304-OC-R1]|uniref:VWA domain-containing protein n=1 Tax=Bacillus sp. S/N-304-OC-R1 TaxID=2758034 RepID=UPI001C8D7FA3|nr:VWA domain-containing protein [Bacillus sp. S/N-304-OC-R1]MBY0124369.1 VWA domain-containing protein [Bacillus sp. S/N-304-OC-R1]
MGRSRRIYLILMLLGSLILSACSQKQYDLIVNDTEEANVEQLKEKEDKEQPNKTIDELLAELPEPTLTETEFIHASKGIYAGKKYENLSEEEKSKILNIFKELPALGETPSDQEIELYWRKALSLFHEDYPSPEDVLDKVAIEALGNPNFDDEENIFKEQLNVQILLDSSGSMGKIIDGKTMMNIAKDSIKEFAASLPEGANIALRVYGHKGSGSNQDKEISCKSNELVYELGTYDADVLKNSLNQIKPAGWTPLAKAIEEAKKDLSSYKSDNNTNIIYIVSDGVETCGGDPVTEAKKLAESDIQPIVNVIGFDLDAEGQQQLKDVAAASKGIYSDARNGQELKKELQRAETMARKWEEWKTDAINNVNSNKYDQFLKNIPSFSIDWSRANNNEDMNILHLFSDLRDHEQISAEARQRLSDKRRERYSLAIEIGKQIEKELRKLTEEYSENVINEIIQKYETQVDRKNP